MLEQFPLPSVSVPKNERTATDVLRIPGKVVKVYEKSGYYQVATQYGLLKGKLRAGDLQSYTENVICNESNEITLRECSRKYNSNNKFTRNHAIVLVVVNQNCVVVLLIT